MVSQQANRKSYGITICADMLFNKLAFENREKNNDEFRGLILGFWRLFVDPCILSIDIDVTIHWFMYAI